MILNDRNKLQGTFEIDEVFLGGKVSGKRGRGAEGKGIIAVAEEINVRKTCRLRLAKIPKATSKALSGFIENNIEKSFKILSDAWTDYTGLDKLGYEHEIQNPSVKDSDEEILSNVHRIASLLKRWLLGTHQSFLNKNKLEYYPDEFVFRYNRRTSSSIGLLFMRLIEQAVITTPGSYKEIIYQNHE